MLEGLTYNDRKAMLAAALGIEEWRIDDISEAEVFYTTDEAGSWRRGYAIGEGNEITLGDAARGIRRTIFEPITVVEQFTLEGEAEFTDDGMVIRSGKLFEAGEYPDKAFAITEDELANVAAEFVPVPNDLEHEDTILSGKLGRLEKVWAQGKELFGAVAIPKWLDDLIGSNPIKASLAWARDTKRIVGNGLVLNPRIPDAQLEAAFNAAKNSGDGGNEMTKPKWFEKLFGLFKSKQLPEGFEDFDPETVVFADAEPGQADSADSDASTGTEEPQQTQDSGEDARFAAVQQENAGLRARLIQSEAERFADEAIQSRRAFPAERESLIAMFKQAVQDDNVGAACFTATGELQEGSRVKVLREMVAARPAHQLTTEQLAELKPESLVLLSSDSGDSGGKMSDERRAELLAAGEIRPQKEAK